MLNVNDRLGYRYGLLLEIGNAASSMAVSGRPCWGSLVLLGEKKEFR